MASLSLSPLMGKSPGRERGDREREGQKYGKEGAGSERGRERERGRKRAGGKEIERERKRDGGKERETERSGERGILSHHCKYTLFHIPSNPTQRPSLSFWTTSQ